MRTVEGIIYDPRNGQRGLGDLYLPERPQGAPCALVIHGGGWNAMDKHGLAGVAEFLCECGFGAFNINYRLLGQAPWPACGDDCLAAARFLLDAGHPDMQGLDRRNLVVVGASAGGHLALMTGLRLPAVQVRAIVAIAGPADLAFPLGSGLSMTGDTPYARKFFGALPVAESARRMASPVHYVGAESPPVLCVHSINDDLVPLAHSERLVAEYAKLGRRAELFSYDGPGRSHGIWIEGTDPHRLLPPLEAAIRRFLATVG
ncbi:MAG: hypothetical protein A3K19_23515 [Lentisphaerae bacterium RIFOXYB12_FULL_65_16]|nr:MAG: hypothetical protein A3K18_29290 [Lentisphaerae bacterium RIFOXYA12_64_32]OGV94067.1 MAG: hypothetical protein A3K19_23515 [Lentisphaerae bacterium RIFOXYB12_FULL_65_16]